MYQAPFPVTEIDFVPGPFRCQSELQHFDFAGEGVERFQGFLDFQTPRNRFAPYQAERGREGQALPGN